MAYMKSLLSSYRDAAEVKEQRATRDPINKLVDYALDGELVTEAEFKVCMTADSCDEFRSLKFYRRAV